MLLLVLLAGVTGVCGGCVHGEVDGYFTCSCPDQDLIVSGDELRCGKTVTTLPALATHVTLGPTPALHLSGATLSSNITSLHITRAARISFVPQFFMQYNTHLRFLKISHSLFAVEPVTLNLHAEWLEGILLHNLTLVTLNLLVVTQEGHTLNDITVSACTMSVLGEINLATRYVGRLDVRDSHIGVVQPSAIFHDARHVTIHGNTIQHLRFLALDSDVANFTLAQNSIFSVALESLVVTDAQTIEVRHNAFHHIERFGLTWLRPRADGGRLVLADNSFHQHNPGSLVFYYAIHDHNLVISNNKFYFSQCNCTVLDSISIMTDSHNNAGYSFYQEGVDVLKMFQDTSWCVDDHGGVTTTASLCVAPRHIVTVALVAGCVLVTAVLAGLYCRFAGRPGWRRTEPQVHFTRMDCEASDGSTSSD